VISAINWYFRKARIADVFDEVWNSANFREKLNSTSHAVLSRMWKAVDFKLWVENLLFQKLPIFFRGPFHLRTTTIDFLRNSQGWPISDDFGFKINTFVCKSCSHIYAPKTTDHTFQKYCIFRGNFTFSSMETMETRAEPSDNWYFAKGPYPCISKQDYHDFYFPYLKDWYFPIKCTVQSPRMGYRMPHAVQQVLT
jgi:hypothetical protein